MTRAQRGVVRPDRIIPRAGKIVALARYYYKLERGSQPAVRAALIFPFYTAGNSSGRTVDCFRAIANAFEAMRPAAAAAVATARP